MEEKIRDIFKRVYEAHSLIDLTDLRQFEVMLFEHIDAMIESKNLVEQMKAQPTNLELSAKYVDLVLITRNQWVDIMTALSNMEQKTEFLDEDGFR